MKKGKVIFDATSGKSTVRFDEDMKAGEEAGLYLSIMTRADGSKYVLAPFAGVWDVKDDGERGEEEEKGNDGKKDQKSIEAHAARFNAHPAVRALYMSGHDLVYAIDEPNSDAYKAALAKYVAEKS